MRAIRRVAIVGAGAAGLAAARSMKEVFEVQVFEASQSVGGVWVYDEKTDGEDGSTDQVHSSMYASLRTNLPKEVMAYPDFPFPKTMPSFPGHADVASYLCQFASEFSLVDLIQFRHRVINVTPRDPSDRWTDYTVTVQNDTGATSSGKFDAVVVCNGHYSSPKVPSLVGQEIFPGKIVHSHNYRHPDAFCGKRVVVLGAGASGTDIALEISRLASAVFLSHRGKPNTLGQTSEMRLLQTPTISELRADGTIVFSDGSSEQNIDVLLLCTGYEYTFPFLSSECGISVENNTVQRMYRHMLSIDFATLAFLGLPWKVAPFPLFAFQAAHITALWSRKLELPSVRTMEEALRTDRKTREESGIPPRYGHMLGEMQWEYNRNNADAGQLSPLDPVVQKMYFDAGQARRSNAVDYRARKYRIVSATDFRVSIGDENVDVTPPI